LRSSNQIESENRRAGRLARLGHLLDVNNLLETFRDFQLVDLQRSKKTAYEKVYYIRKFLAQLDKRLVDVTREDVRGYLKKLNRSSSATYKNTLAALKVFFRDFLDMPHVVETFRFPRGSFKPKHIPTKEDLQRFYEAIESPKMKALFLMYATTGLRRNEVLPLTPQNIDFTKRMVTPNNHKGKTKQSWISFFNSEAEKILMEYLSVKKPSRSLRLFPMPRNEERQLWKTAREKTGLKITPRCLREWFCCEMVQNGVSDAYVDAFCGRTPRSILARYYLDYSPERLKKIYDRANLKVLS